MKKKSVCIIMATYNGERFLKEQLDSILGQTYKDWMLFVSDDGSTDNTLKILKEYQEKLGKDKLIIAKNNRDKHGAKENFCFAIDNAPEADYYFFSDQDDVWKKDKVELQVREIQKLKGPALVYCDAEIVDQDLKPVSKKTLSEQFTKMPKKHTLARSFLANRVAGCTMCLNKELLDAAKGLEASKIIMHDFYIVLYALSYGSLKFLDKTLNFYRQHEYNVMGAGTDYVQTSLFQKVFKLFSKDFRRKWHEEAQEYFIQTEYLIERNPEKENPEAKNFITVSKRKHILSRIIGFYFYRYRTKDWWVTIERGF